MRKTTQYLYPTKNGYKLVTRTIGTRTTKPIKRKIGLVERLFAPWLLVFTMSICYGMMLGADMKAAEKVQALETVDYSENAEVAQDAEAGQPEPTPTPKPTIEEYILEVFGDDGELMLEIAKCESGLVADRIGDTHLMGNFNGEMIGDSIGIFQIRTGDAGVYDLKPWNRAKANGMSVEEFRTAMKDPYKNVDYAKQIFDRQGLSAWYNCSQKVK
jgi:hypothetical protein